MIEIERGVAPIKKEYLIHRDALTQLGGSSSATHPSDDDEAEALPSTGSSLRKNVRNRNKANRESLPAKTNVCADVARGKPCSKGEDCRFSHDTAALLASKPEDLPGPCPNVTAVGSCKFGISCRFSSSHPVSSGEIAAEGEASETFVSEPPTLLKKLRQGEIAFPKAEEFMRRLKEESDVLCYPWGERRARRTADFQDKLYLAPLTTVGNLPFRRICKEFGVDITCGEMAMCTNVLKGQASEVALLKRHPSEDFFGVQLCGGWSDTLTQCAELLGEQHVECDFVDLNMGCPIDIVFKKGMGSGLMNKTGRLKQIVAGMRTVLPNTPLTVKMRIGIDDGKPLAQKIIPILSDLGVDAITIHGRTRQQRYTRAADWNYISSLVDLNRQLPNPLSIIGNGDILSFEDYELAKKSGVDTVMIARGALMKPWIFTEIKEHRYWDIRSSERLDIIHKYTRYGLEHFGSDVAGVEKTRRFLLEWISFLCRYVPVGILEHLPPRINDRPPAFVGRDDLETLMASPLASDWIRISEMFLGPVPQGYHFIPKHKSNSYETQQG